MTGLRSTPRPFAPIAGGRSGCSRPRASNIAGDSRRLWRRSPRADDPARQRPHDRAANLHRRTSRRRLRRLYGSIGRASSTRCSQPMTAIALFQSTTGIDPAANGRALGRCDRAGGGGGAEMLFTPEMSGLLDRNSRAGARKVLRSQEEDPVLAVCREAAARHQHLAPYRVARRAGRGAARSPIGAS